MNDTKSSIKGLKKQMAAAVAMVTVAAVALGSSTYAWFAQNTNVTANGMSVQAQAEGGIVISNSDKETWTSTATATATNATLFPTSTRDVATWYHNKSTNANDAAASQAANTYETLSLKNSENNNTYGVGYVDANSNNTYDTGEAAYYLLNEFTVKSASNTLSGITFYINSVTVTGTNSSAELDAALRIAIKVGTDSNTYIYAPITGATDKYRVGGAENSELTVKTNDKNVATAVNSIPATDAGVPVKIYAYFEGEDANCKSTNVSGKILDNLSVSVVFGTEAMNEA